MCICNLLRIVPLRMNSLCPPRPESTVIVPMEGKADSARVTQAYSSFMKGGLSRELNKFWLDGCRNSKGVKAWRQPIHISRQKIAKIFSTSRGLLAKMQPKLRIPAVCLRGFPAVSLAAA